MFFMYSMKNIQNISLIGFSILETLSLGGRGGHTRVEITVCADFGGFYLCQ